ncbi:MAG: SDR family NAD(P)-dependent oxidoreductase [Pseudomonadota bacterium]
MRIILGILLFYGRFGPSFTSLGYLSRKLFWGNGQHSLHNQHVLITGASGGIGAAVVSGCLKAGADVTAVARSADKLAAMNAAMPDTANTIVADLAELDDIKQIVSALKARGTKIDILVNNVGVMLHKFAQNSDAIDSQFATNLLNQYALTEALVAEDLLADNAAVITVASGGMYMAPLVIAGLNADEDSSHDGTRAYAIQKRAQVALTQHWQATYGDRASFYVMHPGWVDTAGVRESLPTFRKLLAPILRNAEQGADTIVWLAKTRPSQNGAPGIWFDRKSRKVHAYGFTRERSAEVSDLLTHLRRYLP